MSSVSPPLFSPSSDKRFWSTLRSRVDTLIENRKPPTVDLCLPKQIGGDAKIRLKEDSLLLLRGFDSVAQSLSQLSNNLENAFQGSRDLARPPTLTEIVHATIENAKDKENTSLNEKNKDELRKEDDNEAAHRGPKRKLEEISENQDEGSSEKVKGNIPQELEKFKKAKNLAISMATKAASMGRELKSIRSDLSFVQDRCTLLEEENQKLRDGFVEGIPPDEDDLIRLQLEALLADKSRLANENANLKRENQSLHQLVEYHQLNSEDLSASYESLMRGMGINFCSSTEIADDDMIVKKLWDDDALGVCKSLDGFYDDEEHEY